MARTGCANELAACFASAFAYMTVALSHIGAAVICAEGDFPSGNVCDGGVFVRHRRLDGCLSMPRSSILRALVDSELFLPQPLHALSHRGNAAPDATAGDTFDVCGVFLADSSSRIHLSIEACSSGRLDGFCQYEKCISYRMSLLWAGRCPLLSAER